MSTLKRLGWLVVLFLLLAYAVQHPAHAHVLLGDVAAGIARLVAASTVLLNGL
jgi:hypothetical protein